MYCFEFISYSRHFGRTQKFPYAFSDLVVEENKEFTPICIDARQFGSKARFARASCRPNIKVQHFFLKGKLHIIGIAAGNIERGDEVINYNLSL